MDFLYMNQWTNGRIYTNELMDGLGAGLRKCGMARMNWKLVVSYHKLGGVN